MPEIKNTFMSGKMNKDLDERLVPKHEYRDAQNIEVTTSSGSDVGSLQNTYGNTSKSKLSAYIGKSKCVGSIEDNEHDKIYWFVKGEEEELILDSQFNTADTWSTESFVTIDTANGNCTLGDNGTFSTVYNTSPNIYQQTEITVGEQYTLTFDITSINNTTGNTHPLLWIKGESGGSSTYTDIPSSNAVSSISYTFTATISELRIGLRSSNGVAPYEYNDTTTIDKVSIKKSNIDCIAEYDYKTEIVEPVLVDAATTEEGKFLKFTDTVITGINLLDGMLFWSDGETEPKKINIEHFKNGSNKNVTGSTDEKLNWTTTTKQRDINGLVSGNVLERDITVIKRYPLNAPSLSLSDTLHGEPDLNAKRKSICVVPHNTTYSYNRHLKDGSGNIEHFRNSSLFMRVKAPAKWGYQDSSGRWTFQIDVDVLENDPWLVPKDMNRHNNWPKTGFDLTVGDSYYTEPTIWQQVMDLKQESGAIAQGYKAWRSLNIGSAVGYNIFCISKNGYARNASTTGYTAYLGNTAHIDFVGGRLLTSRHHNFRMLDGTNSYIPQKDDIIWLSSWDAFQNRSFWTYNQAVTNKILPKPPGTGAVPRTDKQGRWLRDYDTDHGVIIPKLESEAQQGLFHYQSRAFDFGTGWIGTVNGYEHTADASSSALYRYVENVAYNIPTNGKYVSAIRATIEITAIDSSVYTVGDETSGSPCGIDAFNGVSGWSRVPAGSGTGTYQIGTYGNDTSDVPDTLGTEGFIKIFSHKGVTCVIKNLEFTNYAARPVRIQPLTFSPKPNFAEGDVVKLTNQSDSTVQVQVKLSKEITSEIEHKAPETFAGGYTRGSNMIHSDAYLPGGNNSLSTPNNAYLYWSKDSATYTDVQSGGIDRAVWSIPTGTSSVNGYLYANYYTHHQSGWVAYNENGTDTDFQLEKGKTYEMVYTVSSGNGANETEFAKLYLENVYMQHDGSGQYTNLVMNTTPSSYNSSNEAVATEHRILWTQKEDATSFKIYADRNFLTQNSNCDSPGDPPTNTTDAQGNQLFGDSESYFRSQIYKIALYPITHTDIEYGNKGSNSDRSVFETEILSISEDIVKLDFQNARYWDAELTELESMYKFRFPRFAYRWRYRDGEYSAISPFTEVAFLPGDEYEFDAIDSYNKSMLNTVRRITLGNFQDKPVGVKQLDILIKESDSTNIYKFASIRGDKLKELKDYTITSEQYEGLLEKAQLLRHFDNVPRKAKAQEISSNRLIYGNYTQQYDILDSELPKISASASGQYVVPKETNKSIKALRNYQVGIAYIDAYGRQTPVFSTPDAVVKLQKESSITANEIVANLKGFAPDWATHRKYYIKDASAEYYNLALDRHYYDDDDEHIWMSFASSDFNKIEAHDYLILKKEHDGDAAIVDKSRYKVLAKEGEAPDFVKFVKRKLGERVFAANGDSLQFTASAVGFPQVGKTTFRVAGNDIHNHSFLAQADIDGVEPRGALMDDQTGRFIKFGKEVNNEVVSMTSFYEILSVSRVNGSTASSDTDFSDSEDYYEFTLIEPLSADIGFVGAHNDSNPEDKGLFFEYYEESDRVDSDAFEGRFFVKIKKDAEILKRISDKNQSAVTNNTLVVAAANMFWAHTFDLNIRSNSNYTGDSSEDGKDGDYTLRNKSLFDWQSNIDSATTTSGKYNGIEARHNPSQSHDGGASSLSSWFPEAIFGHDGWITEPSTGADWDGQIYCLAPADHNKYIKINNPYFGDYAASTTHWTHSNQFKPATSGTWKRSHWRSDLYGEGQQKFCIDQAWAFGWGNSQKLYPTQDLSVENNALGTGFVIGNSHCCFRVANIGSQIALESTMVNGSKSGDVLYARGGNTFDEFALTNEFFDDIKVVKALTTVGTKFRWSNDPTNTIYTIKTVVGTGKVRNYHNVQQEFNYGDYVDWNTAQAYGQSHTVSNSDPITGYYVADYGLSYHPQSSTQWGMHSRSNQGYRIALELDKAIVWSPTSSSYDGGSTPIKRLDELASDTASSLAYSSLEIISNSSSSDGGYSTENPAIFEVEPVDNTDFNLYYEASNSSIILRTGYFVEALNNKNVNDLGGNYFDESDVGTTYAPGGTAVLSANAKIIVDTPGRFYIDSTTWNPTTDGIIPAGVTLRVSKKDANGDVEFYEDFIAKVGIAAAAGDDQVSNGTFTVGTDGLDGWTSDTGLTTDTSGTGVLIETGTSTATGPTFKSGNITVIPGEEYEVSIEVLEVNNNVYNTGANTHSWFYVSGSEQVNYRPMRTGSDGTVNSSGNFRIEEPGSYSFLMTFDSSQNLDSDDNPVNAIRLRFELNNTGSVTSYKKLRINNISLRVAGDEVDISSIPVRWHNCFTFGNGVESDRIRDDYNAIRIDKGPKVSTTLDEPYEEEERKNGLIYSGLYNSKKTFNKLNEFIMGLKITKDVNPEYGSLQKLFSRNTDLIAFCEDKVLRILSNKDALYNADGNAQIVASNAVLGQAMPFAGDYGISQNPESFASFGYRAYFTDKSRNTVLRLSMDGLTPISQAGMRGFFKDNLPMSNQILGSYDQDKDIYNITLNGKTVSFAESTNGWTSFKSFLPESAVSLNGSYYTFKNGDIWKHNDNEIRNNFYGVQYSSSVTFLVNDASSIVKDFKTISYEGSEPRIKSTTTESGQALSRGWYASSVKGSENEGQVLEFKNKEGKKFGNITGKNVTEETIDLKNVSTQGLGFLDNIDLNGYSKYFPLNIKGLIQSNTPTKGFLEIDAAYRTSGNASNPFVFVNPGTYTHAQGVMNSSTKMTVVDDSTLEWDSHDEDTNNIEFYYATGVVTNLIPGNKYYIEATISNSTSQNDAVFGFSSRNMVDFSETRYRTSDGKVFTEFVYSPDGDTFEGSALDSPTPEGIHFFKQAFTSGKISSLTCTNLTTKSTNKWILNTSTDSTVETVDINNNYAENSVVGVSPTVTHEFYIHPKTINTIKYAVAASNYTVTSSNSNVTISAIADMSNAGYSDNIVKVTIKIEYPSGDEFPTQEERAYITVDGNTTIAIDQ